MSGRSSGCGEVPIELGKQIQKRAMEQGLYAANMPAEAGGGGLDFLSATLMDRELGKRPGAWSAGSAGPRRSSTPARATSATPICCRRCAASARRRSALTEPNAGSDAMSIQTRATARTASDYVINGSKHFISCVTTPDFVILFTVTGVDETPKGPRKRITAFLVDVGTPGFEHAPRPAPGQPPRLSQLPALASSDCRVPARNILGEEGKGFDQAGQWLANTRILVAANCCGKAERALRDRDRVGGHPQAVRPDHRQVPGRQLQAGGHGDRAARRRSADHAGRPGNTPPGTMTNGDAAMAKLFASEMARRVTDHAIQILGGMGLMDELPLEMLWRDARIERIWDGTSEIQRHIISRELLRPLNG